MDTRAHHFFIYLSTSFFSSSSSSNFLYSLPSMINRLYVFITLCIPLNQSYYRVRDGFLISIYNVFAPLRHLPPPLKSLFSPSRSVLENLQGKRCVNWRTRLPLCLFTSKDAYSDIVLRPYSYGHDEYIAPELFLLLMSSLFTFYRCLPSPIIFASVLSFFYLYLLLMLYTPEVR